MLIFRNELVNTNDTKSDEKGPLLIELNAHIIRLTQQKINLIYLREEGSSSSLFLVVEDFSYLLDFSVNYKLGFSLKGN